MKRHALFAALLMATAAHAAGDANDVVECMRANLPDSARIQNIELTTTDRAGNTRELRGNLFVQSEKEGGAKQARAMLRVEHPDTLRGASFLVREVATGKAEPSMFIYLPSVRRVRRVVGDFGDGAMLGTDFSYNDFRQLQSSFVGFTTKGLKAGSLDGRAVHMLSLFPGKDNKTVYTRVDAWVDQKSCVPLKLEFYSRSVMKKQLLVSGEDLKESNGYWYPAEVQMADMQSGTQSHLRVLSVTSGKPISSRYFNPALFYMGGN